MRIFLLVIVSCVSLSCTPGRWKRDYTALGTPAEKLRGKETPRVLFVGNSFTMGVPEEFRKAAAMRGKRVETGVVAHDRWTLRRHMRSQETREMMRRGWDVIVFQERSDHPVKWWERNWFMIPALGTLAADAADHGAVPVLYQTWGYRDCFKEMNPCVAEGSRKAAESLGGITIIPVGNAWAAERKKGNGAQLFRPDGKHPTRYGNQVTARAFCEAFWGNHSAQ